MRNHHEPIQSSSRPKRINNELCETTTQRFPWHKVLNHMCLKIRKSGFAVILAKSFPIHFFLSEQSFTSATLLQPHSSYWMSQTSASDVPARVSRVWRVPRIVTRNTMKCVSVDQRTRPTLARAQILSWRVELCRTGKLPCCDSNR